MTHLGVLATTHEPKDKTSLATRLLGANQTPYHQAKEEAVVLEMNRVEDEETRVKGYCEGYDFGWGGFIWWAGQTESDQQYILYQWYAIPLPSL
jgi:hypothetical protein